MNISTSTLETRMAALPAGDLQAIVNDQSGQYTEEARDVAATVLASSRSLEIAPQYKRQVSYVVEDAIAAPLYAYRRIRPAVRQRQRSLLPARTPQRICDLFWFGLAAALPALNTVVAHSQSAQELSSLSNLSLFLLAFSGLLLSYGILTEKRYPRHLAVVFAIAWLFLPLRRRDSSDEDSWWEIALPVTWTYEMISYLLQSPEVSDYYELLARENAPARPIPA